MTQETETTQLVRQIAVWLAEHAPDCSNKYAGGQTMTQLTLEKRLGYGRLQAAAWLPVGYGAVKAPRLLDVMADRGRAPGMERRY